MLEKLQAMFDAYRSSTGEDPGCWVMNPAAARKVAESLIENLPADYQPKTMILLGLPVIQNSILPDGEIVLVSKVWYTLYAAGSNGAS